jgi:hypothetical protein
MRFSREKAVWEATTGMQLEDFFDSLEPSLMAPDDAMYHTIPLAHVIGPPLTKPEQKTPPTDDLL